MKYLKKYWAVIIIILLSISLTFTYNLYTTERAEKERIQMESKVGSQVGKVEEKQSDVDRREREVYPGIDKKLSELKKKQKEVKRKVEDDIKKDDIDSIARKFTMLG